jgi:hypothetical protein
LRCAGVFYTLEASGHRIQKLAAVLRPSISTCPFPLSGDALVSPSFPVATELLCVSIVLLSIHAFHLPIFALTLYLCYIFLLKPYSLGRFSENSKHKTP